MQSEAVWAFEPFADVRVFLETGGDVLWFISFVLLAMWALILERLWYFAGVHPKEAQRALATWEAREDRSSWYADQIRRKLVSKVQVRLDSGLIMIKTLVALCPLLGLLGTVTGMIEVFDVMAISGSGNARAMASGVSKATIPTMAGMVAALSGLIVSVQMERYARQEGERLADRLTHREQAA
jgi:biopolymer transport protein ExbB